MRSIGTWPRPLDVLVSKIRDSTLNPESGDVDGEDPVHVFDFRGRKPAILVSGRLSGFGAHIRRGIDAPQPLFCITTEALTNVERHAGAQQVEVRLACGSDLIDLVIRDDGVGFDPAAIDADRYGLTGMQERAGMIGAALEVTSHPGGGTEVWCTLKR